MHPATDLTLEPLIRVLAQSARAIGPTNVRVRGIAIDSRSVEPGVLFVALRGEHADGHDFIGEAASRGAGAIVMEELVPVPEGVTAVIVPDSARALSQLADAFYGTPSAALSIAGITGTNGKTTTAQMTAAIMNAAGIPTGCIGTLGATFGDEAWPLANTTPLASQLQELLARMRDRGARGVAMEVSSHALALQRVEDVRMSVGALTNVTRDHLDFHKTFDAYAAAKRHLFDLTARCVLNADDELGDRWIRELRGRKPVFSYAQATAADVRAERVEMRPDGSRFSVDGIRYDVHLPGRFNVSNALCALGIARSLGIDDRASARGLDSLERVAGRMEHLHEHGLDVVIDYAHTPDALENVLRSVRETTARRLIVVFGCGGDRDRGKRAQMGAAAARFADFTVLTSDNPRSEDPRAIIDEIVPGLSNAPHCIEPDRRAAIEQAVGEAQAGDVVLIAGKGHERYQVIGARVLEFDDVKVAREALARRAAPR